MCSLGIKHKTLALLAMLYCLSYGNVMAVNVMHIINDNKWDIQKCWFKIPLILHLHLFCNIMEPQTWYADKNKLAMN